ncbi:MAG TPA: phosphotransferase [Vicinamibacterales bacterium]|nr:phosphotransferase [Vicinamibacterales bacterium]
MTDSRADDTPLPPAYLEWCRRAVTAWAGVPVDITRVQPVPSRAARLVRLTGESHGRVRHFYLKMFTALDPSAFAAWCEALERIGRAFAGAEGLLAFDIVAYDAARHLILTAESEGRPIRRLQRRLPWSRDARRASLDAWRGVGRWLDTLHWRTIPAVQSADRAAALAGYVRERLRLWSTVDARHADLSRDAEHALGLLAGTLGDRPVTLTRCHGDISSGNVIIGRGVGLIDFDDSRTAMPGLDVSQVLLALEQFCRLASLGPMPRFHARAVGAFLEGYGGREPEGPEFWLPHLRNLSVAVVTVGRRQDNPLLSRASSALHYRRLIEALRRAVRIVRDTGGWASYLPHN